MNIVVTDAEIPSYQDVWDHPMHWYNHLYEMKENSFNLFKYGPWLTRHAQSKIESKNDIFRFLNLFQRVYRNGNFVKSTYNEMKECMVCSLKDSRCLSGEYQKIFRQFVEIMLEDIRKMQRDSHSLENMVVDTPPIKNYLERYSDFSNDMAMDLQKKIGDMTPADAINTLHEMLISPPCLIQILRDGDIMLDAADPKSASSIATIETPTISEVYFTLCFLIEMYLTGKVKDPFAAYRETSQTFMSIMHGDKVNITGALESLEIMMGK